MEQVNNAITTISPYLGQIAPYLIFAVYVVAALAAIALLAFIVRMLFGACNGLLKQSSRLLIFISILSLIYFGLDMVAGGANVNAFNFYQQPFWMIFAIALVMGIVFRMFASLRPTRDA